MLCLDINLCWQARFQQAHFTTESNAPNGPISITLVVLTTAKPCNSLLILTAPPFPLGQFTGIVSTPLRASVPQLQRHRGRACSRSNVAIPGCSQDQHVGDLASDEVRRATVRATIVSDERRRFLIVARRVPRFLDLENVADCLGRLLPSLSRGLPRRATDRTTAKQAAVASLVTRQITYTTFHRYVTFYRYFARDIALGGGIHVADMCRLRRPDSLKRRGIPPIIKPSFLNAVAPLE